MFITKKPSVSLSSTSQAIEVVLYQENSTVKE